MTFLNLKREHRRSDTDIIARPERSLFRGIMFWRLGSVLIAFAENKLTETFPDNLDALDLGLLSFKEKGIRLKDERTYRAKHQVNFGYSQGLYIPPTGLCSTSSFTPRRKGGFWNMPDMKVPVNELTLHTHSGGGYKYRREYDGEEMDLIKKTSEYILQRYIIPPSL